MLTSHSLENHQKLAERDFAIVVFIDLSDHFLESQMGLRCLQLLHHVLQLLQIQESITAGIVPE